MDHLGNPFGMLTFIIAPAMLTNASSIMTLTTSNRLARAVDHARSLATLAADRRNGPGPVIEIRRQLQSAARRVSIVVRALTAFYVSVGSFAAVGLLSLLGVVFAVDEIGPIRHLVPGVVLCIGVAGVLGLVSGTGLLVWETRLALRNLSEETAFQLKPSHLARSADGASAIP